VSVHELVTSYGYAAVFALVAIESLGIPLPGETVLIAGATYAGVTHRLSIWFVFLVGAAGAVVGDTLGYWIGDLGGYKLLRRYGRYVRMDEPKIKVARYLFDRRGGVVVFFGRFVSILRTYAAFLAGTNKMPYHRFLLFNVSGGIFWAALYCALAYNAAGFLSHASTPFAIGAGCLAVVILIVGFLLISRHIGALTAMAEAAYPGPLEDHPAGRQRAGEPGRGPDVTSDRERQGEVEVEVERRPADPERSSGPGDGRPGREPDGEQVGQPADEPGGEPGREPASGTGGGPTT
jgi:membrane protein DedA with SNARE-associated domain